MRAFPFLLLLLACTAAPVRDSRVSEVTKPEVEKAVKELSRPDVSPIAVAGAADLLQRLQRELELSEKRNRNLILERDDWAKEREGLKEKADKYDGARNLVFVIGAGLLLLLAFMVYRKVAGGGLL